MKKLEEFKSAGRFNIIDNWTHNFVESLPRDVAIAKYGYCDVCGSYTSKSCDLPDGNGKTPSFEVDVWVEIPGMKIGVWNGENLHLRFIGDENEATFTGKKSGQLVAVNKWGADDYSVWWRDASEKDYLFAGHSVRGTANDIIRELEGEI